MATFRRWRSSSISLVAGQNAKNDDHFSVEPQQDPPITCPQPEERRIDAGEPSNLAVAAGESLDPRLDALTDDVIESGEILLRARIPLNPACH